MSPSPCARDWLPSETHTLERENQESWSRVHEETRRWKGKTRQKRSVCGPIEAGHAVFRLQPSRSLDWKSNRVQTEAQAQITSCMFEGTVHVSLVATRSLNKNYDLLQRVTHAPVEPLPNGRDQVWPRPSLAKTKCGTIKKVRVSVKGSPAEGRRRLHTNTAYVRLSFQRAFMWGLGLGL